LSSLNYPEIKQRNNKNKFDKINFILKIINRWITNNFDFNWNIKIKQKQIFSRNRNKFQWNYTQLNQSGWQQIYFDIWASHRFIK
jgi:Iap family predicted aminopeptidase